MCSHITANHTLEKVNKKTPWQKKQLTILRTHWICIWFSKQICIYNEKVHLSGKLSVFLRYSSTDRSSLVITIQLSSKVLGAIIQQLGVDIETLENFKTATRYLQKSFYFAKSVGSIEPEKKCTQQTQCTALRGWLGNSLETNLTMLNLID